MGATMARTPVEEIKEKLSILDVVGSYVELHKAGKQYKGKSPFTDEKTPSFFVSPDRGMYFCFSSQKGGDMFTFIEEMEGVDFKGALKILAEKAGVELIVEDPKLRDAREQEYALLEEATKFFYDTRRAHPEVEKYITERGVTDATMLGWRIGYAPDEWRALKVHLTEKKYTEAQMQKAGLIKKTDPNKDSYDVFRDRVMFPIKDSSGRVVAFSGRTLKKEDGIPKYVNSPETDLYKKSEILYGYDIAKQKIRQYDFSLIVEGQFDLVMTHQAGYGNTVAVSGTALTPHHIMLLQRLSNRAVLALDSDRAGVSAVKRSAAIMLERGMDVKVARLEGGKDPADIIKSDPALLKKFVGSAVHVVDFLLEVLKKNSKDERTYKLQVREEILPLILSIPNHIDREHFAGVVGEATQTRVDAIHLELERLAEAAQLAKREGKKETPRTQAHSSAKRTADILEYLSAVAALGESERPELTKTIMKHLKEFGVVRKENLSEKSLFTVEQYLETLSQKALLEDVSDKLTLLAHSVAKERLNELGAQLREAEGEENEKKVAEILKETKSAESLLQQKIFLE